MKYDAFISYSWKDYKDENGCLIDGNVISKITKALSDNGLTYWIDEEGISVGEEFPEIIYDNIMNSGCMIFISSHNSNHVSKWTSKEISLAIEHKKLIIPVICDDSNFKKGINLLLSDVDKFDMTKNPGQQIYEIIKAVRANRDQLLEEKKREEEKRERGKTISTAVATLEILEKNRSKLRKELSRLRGEYDSLSKDFILNQTKIEEIATLLEKEGQPFDRTILEPTDDGVTFEKLLERSQTSDKPETPKRSLSPGWGIILLIVGLIAGFGAGLSTHCNSSAPTASPTDTIAADSAAIWCDSTYLFSSGYVDMGTSKLWAATNYGASSPVETGELVTWTEIRQTLDGTDETLPNVSDFTQLKNSCHWEKGMLDGVKGFYVTSDSTNNQIFLPITSFLSFDDGHYIIKSPDWGVYWTSTLFDARNPDDSKINVFTFGISSDQPVSDKKFRNAKCAVRLVKAK